MEDKYRNGLSFLIIFVPEYEEDCKVDEVGQGI